MFIYNTNVCNRPPVHPPFFPWLSATELLLLHKIKKSRRCACSKLFTYHWLVYCIPTCRRCWRCRDTQNSHKNCWLVWDCFDLGRHCCAGAGAAYLRLQVELHQGEVVAMKVDAKDAKMKQLQEWEKGRRVEVEDEWIRIRPRRQFKQRGGNGCWRNGRKGQTSQKTKSREQRATQPTVRMIKKSESKTLWEIDKESESQNLGSKEPHNLQWGW